MIGFLVTLLVLLAILLVLRELGAPRWVLVVAVVIVVLWYFGVFRSDLLSTP